MASTGAGAGAHGGRDGRGRSKGRSTRSRAGYDSAFDQLYAMQARSTRAAKLIQKVDEQLDALCKKYPRRGRYKHKTDTDEKRRLEHEKKRLQEGIMPGEPDKDEVDNLGGDRVLVPGPTPSRV